MQPHALIHHLGPRSIRFRLRYPASGGHTRSGSSLPTRPPPRDYVGCVSRSQTPVWERASAKLRFALGQAETGVSGEGVPKPEFGNEGERGPVFLPDRPSAATLRSLGLTFGPLHPILIKDG